MMASAAGEGAHEAPDVSVVVPFGDPRGRPEHLASWTRRQTIAPGRFEVVAVAGRKDAAEEAAIRGYLRPHDQYICRDGTGRFALYDVGVRACRAPLVFLTEDHCVAERGCLEDVLAWFADPAREAGSVRWGNINRTAIGHLEEQLADLYTSLWYADGHWNRVRARGFAIRRTVYDAAGGFPERFGEFGEAVLAARLHARGCRVDLLPETGVRHINQRSLNEVANNARSYTWGECLFTDECPDADFCERYFATPSLLRGLAGPEPGSAGATARALAGVLAGRPRPGAIRRGAAALALAGQLTGQLARRAGGTWWPAWRARLAQVGARTRLAWWRWNEARRIRAFEDYWRAVVSQARAEYVAAHPRPRALLRADGPGDATFGPDEIAGPYPVETHHGQRFRWTAPAHTLWLRLPSGPARIELDTLGLRGPAADLPLWVFWNGRPPCADRVGHDGGRVMLRVDASADAAGTGQRLDLLIPALPTPGSPERRRLGLPLGAVHVRPGAT